MKEEFIEVTLSADIDAGELLGYLQCEEMLGAVEDSGYVRLYFRAQAWNSARLGDIRIALINIGGHAAEAEISVEGLQDRDWNTDWLQSIKPIRIGRRFVIRQSWNSATLLPDDLELIVDPRQAFGSGYHSTTQLVIEFLEEIIRGGESVLDAGTGSGILAMASLRLGANSALGLDNDPLAIDCARENAALNGFGPSLTFSLGGMGEEMPGSFSVVLANLDHNTILKCAESLVSAVKPGGSLLVSGFLTENMDEIGAALCACGARAREVKAREEWSAAWYLVG